MKVFSRTRTYYPDVPLFLALIPLIAAINYYLTYTTVRLNGFLLLTYSIDTVQGSAAWFAVRGIVIWLDRRFPYEGHLVRRILL